MENTLIHTPTRHSVNPLSSNGFQFVIQKIPEVNYFSQEVQLPGVSLPSAVADIPKVELHLTGDTPHFEPLSLTFMVDEDLTNYFAIYKWMIGAALPEILPADITQQFSNLDEYSDATLHILTPKNNVIRGIEFVDLHPVDLSGFTLITTNSDTEYVTCTATFEYTYFKILK